MWRVKLVSSFVNVPFLICLILNSLKICYKWENNCIQVPSKRFHITSPLTTCYWTYQFSLTTLFNLSEIKFFIWNLGVIILKIIFLSAKFMENIYKFMDVCKHFLFTEESKWIGGTMKTWKLILLKTRMN